MIWRIEWTETALKEAEHLDNRTKQRIVNAINRLGATQHGDVKRLRGQSEEWRLRVGAWRIRFSFDYRSGTMTVLHVLPRGRAYRD